MERKDDSRKRTVCEHVFFSSIMLLTGLTFCFILMLLAYYTYQTLVGNIHYCSLWIDIPGRMAIILTCYYVACLCGYFPIPRCYQPRWFPEPFILWKFESWKSLFKSLCIPSPSADLIHRLNVNAQNRRERNTLPLYHDENQRLFGFARFARDAIPRRRSAPVYINPEQDVTPEGEFPIAAGVYSSTTEDEDLDEVFQSFDSPEYGGFIPLVKEPSRPRYQSDITDNRATTSQMEELEQEAASLEQKESGDKPLNFPRFPWYYLRHPGGLPPVAKKIHQKNLKLEKREHKKKLKIEKLKSLKTKATVIGGDCDNAEKQSADTIEETKPSEDSKVSGNRGHSIGKVNVDVIPDHSSTPTKDEAKDGRQEASDQKIVSEKQSKKITVPHSTTGTRRRLLISQKYPPQSIVRLHRQKTGVKYIDDLEVSKLQVPKSQSTHRKTYSEVGASGTPEESSTQTKVEKEEKSANVQTEFDRIRMLLKAYGKKNAGTRSTVPSTSESAQSAGTQSQSAAMATTSSQKSEEHDIGDLHTSTSEKLEHDDEK